MENDNGNGRITLAVLSTKLDAIIETQKTIVHKIDNHDDAIHKLENKDGRQDEKIEQLEGRVKSWNLLNSFGVVGAAIMGLWGK